MSIWVHTLVKNEERYIWYALRSVVDFVDKMLIWDTGSSDATEAIIKEFKKIYPKKVDFRQVGEVNAESYTKVRQKMLDETRSDWIMILDGDEVWWEKSIKSVVNTINQKSDKYESIVVPFYNVVGDIYHYQPQKAGRYEILEKKGHLTIRAINTRINGLHVGGAYGSEGYLDENNIPIQQRSPERILFIDAPFLHLTHLKRSRIDTHGKLKYELGISVPENFLYPEVFYKGRPKIVPSPFKNRSKKYTILSLLNTPYRNVKRMIS